MVRFGGALAAAVRGSLAGTRAHRVARMEQNEKNKRKCQEKQQKAAQASGTTCGESAEPAVAPAAAGVKRKHESVDVSESWKAMRVKVGSDGMPVWPLQVRDMIGVGDVGEPSVASAAGGSGKQQAVNLVPAKPASVQTPQPATPAPAPANSAEPALPGGDWVSQLHKVSILRRRSSRAFGEWSACFVARQLEGFPTRLPSLCVAFGKRQEPGALRTGGYTYGSRDPYGLSPTKTTPQPDPPEVIRRATMTGYVVRRALTPLVFEARQRT